jgi:hypothetical protein
MEVRLFDVRPPEYSTPRRVDENRLSEASTRQELLHAPLLLEHTLDS